MSELNKITSYIIEISDNYCTGCGNCIHFCPRKVLTRENHINQRGVYSPLVLNVEACTGCRLCELFCGNFAIALIKNPNK